MAFYKLVQIIEKYETIKINYIFYHDDNEKKYSIIYNSINKTNFDIIIKFTINNIITEKTYNSIIECIKFFKDL